MANYALERDASRVSHAFGVFVDGKNIGWFQRPEEAQKFIQDCINAESGGYEQDEPARADPQEKFRQSVECIRQGIMAQVKPGEEDLANALLDIGVTFLTSQNQVASELGRMAHAMIAQTKMLAMVYSQDLTDDERSARMADVKTHLAKAEA